jgi:hypothetical protein
MANCFLPVFGVSIFFVIASCKPVTGASVESAPAQNLDKARAECVNKNWGLDNRGEWVANGEKGKNYCDVYTGRAGNCSSGLHQYYKVGANGKLVPFKKGYDGEVESECPGGPDDK